MASLLLRIFFVGSCWFFGPLTAAAQDFAADAGQRQRILNELIKHSQTPLPASKDPASTGGGCQSMTVEAGQPATVGSYLSILFGNAGFVTKGAKNELKLICLPYDAHKQKRLELKNPEAYWHCVLAARSVNVKTSDPWNSKFYFALSKAELKLNTETFYCLGD